MAPELSCPIRDSWDSCFEPQRYNVQQVSPTLILCSPLLVLSTTITLTRQSSDWEASSGCRYVCETSSVMCASSCVGSHSQPETHLGGGGHQGVTCRSGTDTLAMFSKGPDKLVSSIVGSRDERWTQIWVFSQQCRRSPQTFSPAAQFAPKLLSEFLTACFFQRGDTLKGAITTKQQRA